MLVLPLASALVMMLSFKCLTHEEPGRWVELTLALGEGAPEVPRFLSYMEDETGHRWGQMAVSAGASATIAPTGEVSVTTMAGNDLLLMTMRGPLTDAWDVREAVVFWHTNHPATCVYVGTF